MKKEKWEYTSKYVHFWFNWNFDISFELCGYFDNRPRINLDLFFFNLTLILPIYNKWTDECVPPKWGIAFHNNTLWIYKGGKGNMSGGNKWFTLRMPWSYDWVRTSSLRKDGFWENEVKGTRKDFYKDEWKNILWAEEYPYTYKLKSGEIQERMATVKVEEREWRRFFLKFTRFGAKIKRTIAVEFNDEVGERSGSWKGGTIGCGYNLLKNETPLECLRRMEKERKFT